MAVLYTARKPLLIARAKRFLVTQAGTQMAVLSVIPNHDTYLSVKPYLSVVTAATNVTLQVTWTDPDTGADSYTWLNNQSIPVGVQGQHEFNLLAQGGQAVQLLVTVSTANQVRVTCSVTEED